MNKRKAFIASLIVAVLVGLVFHLLIPALLAGAMATLLSGLLLMDPLGAQKNAGEIWGGFGGFLVVQGVQTFLSSGLTAAAVARLAGRLRSGWVYLAAVVGAAALQLGLLAVYSFVLFAAQPQSEAAGLVAGFSFFFTLLAAPLTGLACAWAARKWGG